MEALFLLALLIIGGYLLGIIGFFRANAAHREIRALRRQIAALTTRPAEAADSVAEALPPAPGIAGVAPQAMAVAADEARRVAASVPTVPLPASTDGSRQHTAEPVAPPPGWPPPEPPPGGQPRRDLETLLTLRWGVWVGSAALLLAGVFLIRYAVEEGFLGPAARCGLAALLGIVLVAAAEWLTRHPAPLVAGPFRADQAPAGLAAGGIAVLFGAAYGAGPFYGLLDPLPSFAAMAAASAIGLLAALRYGQLTAATGIVGGFVTPALIATPNPSLAGLFAYLAVVSAAALAVVRYTAWTWLGWATAAAGAVWVVLAAAQGGPELWAAASFVPLAAALAVFLLPPEALDHPIGRRLAWVPFAMLGAAGLLLTATDAGNMSLIGMFLLSPVAVARGVTEPRQDRLPWLAALLGLLALLVWPLPAWQPTGEALQVEGAVEAFFPGAWAPALIRPLILAALGFAAFHAAAGLRLERRALAWSALVGAVPVLTLLVSYAQVARFQTDFRWAVVALALAAALTASTALHARAAARAWAGVHAAGAAAALALGCAMLLHDQWLTLAVALLLPPLAWIEARADLPPLRRVAMAVAGVILVRLLLNWYVLDYDYGAAALANGLVAAYAVPAGAFALAARLFRRRSDDRLVSVLEAGAIAFATVFVALEVRHGLHRGVLRADPDFGELALHLAALAVQAAAYVRLARHASRPMLVRAWQALGGAALALGIGLLADNPLLTDAAADSLTLLLAYALPAAMALVALPCLETPAVRRALALYALAGGFAWITLQVRQLFHPAALGIDAAPVVDAELWAWSGAWLVYGIALMVLGVRRRARLLRLAALVVVGLVCLKVFLIDMADLTGLWRVLSFLGLGLALIGLGVVHRRFVLPQARS